MAIQSLLGLGLLIFEASYTHTNTHNHTHTHKHTHNHTNTHTITHTHKHTHNHTNARTHTHTHTPLSLGLTCTSDHHDAETSISRHTTITKDRFVYHWRDSNPHSLGANFHKSKPQSAPSPKSDYIEQIKEIIWLSNLRQGALLQQEIEFWLRISWSCKRKLNVSHCCRKFVLSRSKFKWDYW